MADTSLQPLELLDNEGNGRPVNILICIEPNLTQYYKQRDSIKENHNLIMINIIYHMHYQFHK